MDGIYDYLGKFLQSLLSMECKWLICAELIQAHIKKYTLLSKNVYRVHPWNHQSKLALQQAVNLKQDYCPLTISGICCFLDCKYSVVSSRGIIWLTSSD